MNSRHIKTFEFNFTDYEESTFLIVLDNDRNMHISMWSFYLFMSDIDENLSYYCGKFPEWEKVTEDLISLGYDFKTNLEKYLDQFSDSQIEEFSFENDNL